MMAKKVTKIIKLALDAGKANWRTLLADPEFIAAQAEALRAALGLSASSRAGKAGPSSIKVLFESPMVATPS